MADTEKERKLNHGIKVTQQGVDVKESDINEVKKSKSDSKRRILPHLLYAIALPYFYGAKTQIERYKHAAVNLKQYPVNATQTCLHEVSCLFEDLATVTKYAEMCGHSHDLHPLWLDVRNHIRHDIREEFDNETDARKNARAKRLGLNPKLQISIGFEPELIKVGGTVIEISTIEDYLAWAESVIGDVLADAQEKGWIS